MKQTYSTFAAVLFIGLLVFLALRTGVDRNAVVSEPSTLPTTLSVQASPVAIIPSPIGKPAPSSAPSVSLEIAVPSREEVRAEVAKDPHATPFSLMKFAASLGPKLEASMASEDTAKKFFSELTSCTEDTQGGHPESARALCLHNAHLLREKYSSLKEPYETLRNSVPERIGSLADIVNGDRK